MSLQATYCKYDLEFKRPSGTSRGVLKTKETWFIKLSDDSKWGIGECGILRGLSADDLPDYEQKLAWACEHIQMPKEELYSALKRYPSIVFGLEQAFLSLASTDPFKLFETDFTSLEHPIQINGLIWMGAMDFMKQQIYEKLAQGVRCIKIKVGALDFEEELKLIEYLRTKSKSVELRLDANGGFSVDNAAERLERLAEFDIHSIEQPINPEHKEALAQLCQNSPIPIALDESLIGVFESQEQRQLLEAIKPQYIILKPSFIGGFKGTKRWIEYGEHLGIGWWITSALESNIGLNAIAQWTYSLGVTMPQGLGTGSLFTNNISSPLEVENDLLYYRASNDWNQKQLASLCM